MVNQHEIFRKLKNNVLNDLIILRKLMNEKNPTKWTYNQINKANERLKYYLEPINPPPNQLEFNFVNRELVNKLLEDPVALIQVIEGNLPSSEYKEVEKRLVQEPDTKLIE